MDLQELLEKKATLAKEIRQLGDKFNENDKQWTDATQEANWDKLNADYDENEKAITKFENARAIANRTAQMNDMIEGGDSNPDHPDHVNSGNPTVLRGRTQEEIRCMAFSGYITAQAGGSDLTEEMEAAAEATGLNLNAKALQIPLLDNLSHAALQNRFNATPESRRELIMNAPLESATAASGGNMIPPETMMRSVEVNMLAFGGILQVADTLTTATGEPLSWPTADDTGNTGRILSQNAPHDDNAGGGTSGDGGPNPTFNKVIWTAFDYTSDTILVPYTLMRDAVAGFTGLPSMIGAMIGERLGRILATHLTVGTGTGQPNGIVPQSALGVTAASATAIAPDEVYDLQHSVDPAYRNGGRFMCHDLVIAHLRKLKDAENRYLWQSNFNTGAPDTLAGSPITVSMEMPNTLATGNRTLLFGRLSAYKYRRVGSMRFYRLTERYRERDQDGFVAMMSADGGLFEQGTPQLRHLAMA